MEDWTERTDEDVFLKVGEQCESQTAYWRDIEIKRRLYLLQKSLLNAQINAVETQKIAIAVSKRQSTFMLISAVGALATAIVTFVIGLLEITRLY
jgi:hypothetical protein